MADSRCNFCLNETVPLIFLVFNEYLLEFVSLTERSVAYAAGGPCKSCLDCYAITMKDVTFMEKCYHLSMFCQMREKLVPQEVATVSVATASPPFSPLLERKTELQMAQKWSMKLG